MTNIVNLAVNIFHVWMAERSKAPDSSISLHCQSVNEVSGLHWRRGFESHFRQSFFSNTEVNLTLIRFKEPELIVLISSETMGAV